MPISPTTAGIITTGVGAGLNIFDTIFNAASQGQANRRNENFAREMYDRQRTDAITDRDFQNSYNSPAAQMERLKAAGLNPNLVYGNGAAQSQSAVTRSSSPQDFKATPARSDSSGAVTALAAGLNQMYSLAKTQAETNNLQANHNVIVEDAALRRAQTDAAAAGAEKSRYESSEIDSRRRLNEFQLRQDTRLADIKVTQANLENAKLKADTQFTLDQNQRAAILQSYSVKEAVSRLLSMDLERAKTQAERERIQQEIKNLDTDQKLKQQDLFLKNQGIQPHDNLFMRIAAGLYNDIQDYRGKSYINH